MSDDEYTQYEKIIKDALVEARGKRLPGTREEQIQMLEQRLETARLTQQEIAEIQKRLKQLRAR
ncbi:MAG: hypothetical protein ABL873_02385 [Gallionella sp.]|nr:hypothetical protein [Gallionella sp.]